MSVHKRAQQWLAPVAKWRRDGGTLRTVRVDAEGRVIIIEVAALPSLDPRGHATLWPTRATMCPLGWVLPDRADHLADAKRLLAECGWSVVDDWTTVGRCPMARIERTTDLRAGLSGPDS